MSFAPYRNQREWDDAEEGEPERGFSMDVSPYGPIECSNCRREWSINLAALARPIRGWLCQKCMPVRARVLDSMFAYQTK